MADFHLCVSGRATNRWNSPSLPDEEGQAPRPQGLKVHRSNHLHFQYCAGGSGTRDVFAEDIHQYRHWDICWWHIHPYIHILVIDISSQGIIKRYYNTGICIIIQYLN